MESFTGSSAGCRSWNLCRQHSEIEIIHLRYLRSTSHRQSRPTRFAINFQHGLLILMFLICLAPVSTLARPSTSISDLVLDIRSPSKPNGEIIGEDRHGGSSLPLLETTQFHSDDIAVAHCNDDLPVERRSTTTSSNPFTGMPAPFDTISNNFANATCVAFFRSFLSNSTIMNCHAVSLLLETSNSFFHMLASAVATSHVLDVACSQPVTTCATTLSSLAKEMLRSENCGPDFDAGNYVVQSTYRDLMAYEPMYHATCLINPDTQDYCFVDAVTNTTTPNDYNVYFMPLGSSLGAKRLTCNRCLQATMNIFAHWALVDGQSLDSTYLASARNVNTVCGPGFANTHVTVGSDAVVTSGSGPTVSLSNIRRSILTTGLLGVILAGL